jgi:hypothetical protein
MCHEVLKNKYQAMLGGYHIFMIHVESSFHKTIDKQVRFSLSSPKIYILGKGINISFRKKIFSQFANFQNFENNGFSFASSHKSHIIY